MSAPWVEKPGRSRYRPTATIHGSIGLHCVAALGAAMHPELWPWAAGGIAGNHALLTAIGLWPRSALLGPNLRRLPEASANRGEIAITFDDGPDPRTTPRVLDLLDAHGARASFFCIAERARRHPATCREIVRRGHAIENHSRRHSPAFAFSGIGGFRREIASAQALLAELGGREPIFFRAPAGIRNPLLEPVLHELGLRLASWTRRGYDTRNRDAGDVSARLTKGLAAGDILLLHDGGSAQARSGEPVVLEALATVLAAAGAQNLRAVTLHHAVDS
ncbi:MAG TPA: polysaccharide deacetylase family protein [Usitatibacter sp.]|nr:polysaccharide deacetylase family protein [Usitatibacter sp.]